MREYKKRAAALMLAIAIAVTGCITDTNVFAKEAVEEVEIVSPDTVEGAVTEDEPEGIGSEPGTAAQEMTEEIKPETDPVSAIENNVEDKEVRNKSKVSRATGDDSCGTDLSWSFDDTTGVLAITGTGEMTDFASADEVPWSSHVDSITEIVFEEGITGIGNYAFQGLSAIQKITLPDSIEKIGIRAFQECIALESVELPDSLTSISNHTFYKCAKLKEIVVPEGVTYIGKSAFCYCENLASVELPEGITELALYAFYECKSLTSVKLPDSIEKLGYQVFADCTGLTEINIPLNWKECPTSATDGTINADYCSHIFEGCKNLTTVNVPDGMTELPSYAFAGCNYLKNVNLPTTLTTISNQAFYECERLTSIEIPENVLTIEKSAFCYCDDLTEITMYEGITEIELYAFYDCDGITSVGIPDTVESIGYQAFANCGKLKNVSIPLSWKECPTSAKDGSVSSEYCGHIFEGCKKLTVINVPEGMEELPGFAFASADYLENVELPFTLTKLNNHSFADCDRLERIEIPFQVTYIGKTAFGNCKALAEVNITGEVTRLGSYAFYNCDALTSLRLPDSIEEIGYQAMAECANLSKVNIPLNWKECFSTSSEGTISTSYCGSIFYDSEKLISVTLPEGMEEVPAYAFANCNYLKNIVLPDSITKINEYAFYKCLELNSIAIPDKVTAIPEYAFYNCESLMCINMGENVKEIGKNAFYGCDVLEDINYKNDEDSWAEVDINSSGNSKIDEVNFNFNYNIVYTEKDFIALWEGEYSGQHNDTTPVQRHFVMDIENIEQDGTMTGTVVFSPSKEVYSQYSASGSYYFSGYVNLDTGVFFLQGHTWIEYPDSETTSNWTFVTFDGKLSIDKIYMEGKNDNLASRKFYVNKIGKMTTSGTSVLMMRKVQAFNILKEEQWITRQSDEQVSVIVTPDWKDAEPGTVLMYQGDVIIESKTGIFLDISPGLLFKESGTISISLVDADGNFVDSKRTKLKIIGASASRTKEMTDNIRITVHENKYDPNDSKAKYVASLNAQIDTGKQKISTGTEGYVLISPVVENDITVSKEGYVTRTIPKEKLSSSMHVYLEKTSDRPVISAVWAGKTDVIRNKYSINLLSTNSLDFQADVEWGGRGYGSIVLFQDGKTVEFNDYKVSTVLSDQFDVSEPIYIIATDGEGNETKKKLKFEANGGPLEGAEFSFGDELKITLPDDFYPDFFAGTEISAGVSSMVPITVSAADGKLNVAIGLELLSGEYEKTGDEVTKDTGVVNFIDKFKDTGILDASDTKESIEKFKNLKNNYKDEIKKRKGTFGVEASYTILGYAEGVYDEDGNVTWIGGGVVFNPKVDVKKDLPFSIWVIPMYFETGLSVDVTAQLNAIFDEQAKNFMPDGRITGKIKANGGVGAGVKHVLYVGGGLEGTLKPDWKMVYGGTDTFKLTATMNAYAKIGIIGFEGKKPYDPFYDEVWVDLPKNKKMTALDNSTDDSIYDTSTYELKDLSYLENDSKFEANSVKARKKNSVNLIEQEVKTNVYKETTPEFIELSDGTQMMVWLDANASDFNQIYLYYSYNDGTGWSEPAIVSEDGTIDNTPYLAEVGGKVYVAWQNSTKNFEVSEDLTLDSTAEYFDISVAEFDSSTNTFVTNTIENSGLDMIPCLCGDDENLYVVWTNNADNDWMGEGENNTILYSKWNGTTWDLAVKAYDNLNAVNAVAADYNGELKIAYAIDTDGDITTSEDTRVYENGNLVSDDESPAGAPTYFEHELYWYSDSNILNEKMEAGTGVITSSLYEITKIDGQKVVVYVKPEGLSSTLMVSYFNEDSGTWENGKALTDASEFIGAYSVANTKDGDFAVLINQTTVTGTYESEDPYGTSALVLLTEAEYADLAIDNIMYSEDEFNAGEMMYFDFELTNNGTKVIDSTVIEILDDSGNVLSTMTLEDLIIPGATVRASTGFEIDENSTGQEIMIKAYPSEISDINSDNNSKSVKLGYENVRVENLTWAYNADGDYIIHADIVNRGYETKKNLSVSLRKDSEDGEVIATQIIDTAQPLEIQIASFTVDKTEGDLFFVVLDDCEDASKADNADFITIYEEGRCTDEHVYEETIEKASFTADGTIISECSVCGDFEKDEIAKVKTPVLSVNSYVYNNAVKTPAVTVKDADGKLLEKGTDYTVSYSSGRKNVGRYAVTVTLKGNYSGSKKVYFTIVPKKTSSLKAERYQYGNQIKLTWTKVTGASGYRIEYKKPGATKYTFLTNTKNLSYTKSGLTANKTYYFKVTPYLQYGTVKYYGTGTTAYRTISIATVAKGNKLVQVGKPTLTKSGTKVKVSWNNVANETGYEISQSTSSTGTKIVATYKTTSGKSKLVSATKGKTFYYKVRAYRTVSGKKIYGPWSSVKSYKR